MILDDIFGYESVRRGEKKQVEICETLRRRYAQIPMRVVGDFANTGGLGKFWCVFRFARIIHSIILLNKNHAKVNTIVRMAENGDI